MIKFHKVYPIKQEEDVKFVRFKKRKYNVYSKETSKLKLSIISACPRKVFFRTKLKMDKP